MSKKDIKILLVDDAPINIKILEEILTFEEEYICQSVTSGEACLAMMAEFKPDIVLLDVMMPGVSGYDVCKIIKNDPAYKATRIIMLSGRAMPAERQEGLDAGADAYLTKPFDDEELLLVIKKMSVE